MSLDIIKNSGMEKELSNSQSSQVLIDNSENITKKELKASLPSQLSIRITDDLVDKVNNICMDPEIAKEIRNNFIGFNNVIKDGKFKVDHYLSACSYVTYKMMGYSNIDSYKQTFPDRYAKLVAAGKDAKHISAFVSAYNKNKLVNLILDQALIPSYLLNQDLFQDALNHQAFLMHNAKSEKVQSDAAKSILDALKQPEKSKIEIDVAVKDNSGIKELKEVMVQVAENQVNQIISGTSTKAIAHKEIFDQEKKPNE